MIIKRIDVLSAAKMYGIIAAAIGLFAGVIFLLFGGLLGGLMGRSGGFAAFGGVLGVIVLPILYGIFGFIGGAIQAFIYNIAAKYAGGLVIETE